MLLKTITAKDMSEAMTIVRREFGDQAIIVSSTEVGGQIKVTAALDKMPMESMSLQDDISLSAPDNPVDIIAEAFDKHRLPRQFGDKILDEVELTEIDDPVIALATVLEARYGFKPLQDSDPSIPLILVGPPGVGKTSLTAKIAARCQANQQPCRVITTDILKAGAVEHLKSFTDILNQPLFVGHTPEELGQHVSARASGEMCVIDTVGINPFLEDDLKKLIREIKAAKAEPVLVMSAGGDAIEAGDMAVIFKEIGVRRFVYTRMDISRKFASLLTIADRGDFSFADASISPLVAEGFNALNPIRVAKIFLEE